MSRSPVSVRPAALSDVPVLCELWHDILRRGSSATHTSDVVSIIESTALREDAAVVVAEYDGAVAGAVFLQATTLTPINLEPAVLAVSPHVLPAYRRKGVGTALIEAAVRFADQHGIAHVATAANSDARDANRFMARLALAPQATLRAATTTAVRARLSSRRTAPGAEAATNRHIDRVLAARRVLRERVHG